MKRKIHVMLLMAFLLLFMGMPIYAAEEISSQEASSETPVTFSQTSSTNQPGVDKNKETTLGEKEEGKKENDPQDTTTSNLEENSKDSGKEATLPGKTEGKPEEIATEEAEPEVKGEDKTPKAQEQATGEKTPEADPATDPKKEPVKAPETPTEDEEASGEETGQGQEPKESKLQVDPDDSLKKLQNQIKTEKDPKKKAALEKEYSDKLFKAIEESGADKLNKEVLNRFTDKERTDEFYKLQEEYETLKKKAEKGTLTQEEVDAFNKKVGRFKPPRKLDADEVEAQKKLADSVDVPGLQKESTDAAKAKLKAYNEAKKALQKALDADKTEGKAGNLAELVKAFEDAEKALKDGIKDGSIKPTYTDGEPKVRVFPLINGSVGDELTNDPEKDAPYYIPDNTDINLLVHVNKDEEPKDFTFTIRAVDQGAIVEGEEASGLAFLNGNPVDLKKNDDGSYSFTVSSKNMNFGIAQLRFHIPGFEGPFHKGFDLEMDLGNNNKVTKQFRITKKGYEDDAKIDGPGSDKDDDPTKIPEIDAGKTENAVVDKETDKVHDFFTYLKKSNTYIDNVTFNSGNGQSLPLSSVDITITVPKSGEDNFAEMIHKSGLKYQDLGNGKYQLKLDTKVFGGNLTEKDGKFYLKGENGQADKELTAANLKDVLLENAGKKVYVDKDGNAHEIITSEVLTDKDGNYKVEGGKLYKKNDKDQSKFDEIGTFVNGKIEKDGKTYVLEDNKLISYTKEYDVYEGNVVNKEGKADPDVTPTYEGKQVTIETTKDGKTETSYGGTIVKNAIYDKNGKIFKEKDYQGVNGEQVIDASGKKSTKTVPSEGVTEVKDSNGNLLYKYFVDDGKTYRIVKDAVFKGDYIVDGLEYKDGLSLIDKFGKKMDIEVSRNETDGYTFTRIVKDNQKETVNSGENATKTRKVIVDEDENKQILVNSKNEVVENTETDGKKPYEIVGPKYYYDGTRFVEATDSGLKGNKFLTDFKEVVLEPTTKYSYKDGDKTTEIENFDKKSVYEGSLNPKDYFKVEDTIYVKKSQGAGSSQTDYYVSADPTKSNEILSVKKIAKIVQILGEGDKAIEKVTDETDIFNAVQNAKFALRFPGFLAGKNIVYNLHADVKATYKKPVVGKEGEFEEQSIFSEKDGIKKVDKFFTLKNKKTTNTTFFKNAPDALTKDPAVNLHFFNIFYRNADDRQRDQLIADLLELEAKVNKAEEAIKTATDKEAAQKAYDKLVKENKEKIALLAKFKYELGRVKSGAKFIIKVDEKADQTNGPVYVKNNEGKTKLFIVGEDGKEIKADELNKMRSLLWEVGFENTEGSLFPENKDSEIIIEDHNMDNRLIYDEIIVNDTQKNWDAAKKAFESNEDNKDKKFGNEEYFFLDQIKDIRFGVSPNYIDGRFVPLGENFCITGDEIIAKLGDKEEITITKGDINFKITRDKANGQVRIKVMNAFYKKVEKDPTHKFESPVQKAYQDKITNLLTEVDKLSEKTTTKDIEGIVKTLHAEGSECFGIIKQKLTEEFNKVKETPKDLDKFKADLKAEIQKIKLGYLDKSKHKDADGNSIYKYDDMRFNAIRIGLNPNIIIGGAMNPQNTKKLGITSVIIPEIDIPYTDEFGNPITNKDVYVKAEIEKILKEGIAQGEGKDKKTYKKDDLKNEEKFREIMAEAYKRVNAKSEDTFKKLVTVEDSNKDKVGMEKYTVTKGSALDYKDLAVNGQSLKNNKGFAINPWYIGEGDKAKSVEQIFEKKFGEKYAEKLEYKALHKMPIDIAAYYMSNQGYDRSRYANQANYKLAGGDKKDGIFGSDSDWHKKICYPGIGHCIEQAGKDSTPDKKPEAGKFGTEGQNGADFGLTYEPTNEGPDKENPEVDKSTKDKEVDISDEKTEKSVDFTIEVTVDKMTKEQKGIADALTPEKPEKPEAEMTDEEKKAAEAEKKAKNIEAGNYNEKTGYYEYKNSLIIDFLPEIFKLKQGETKLTFDPDKDKLMANGANAGFKDEKAFEKWKNGITYFYTDDVMSEYEKLSKSSKKEDQEKAEVLKKAIDDAKASGKIKDGQKVQAVLAWLPNFEAPHGSKKQFTFKLSNVFVDKKKFKDFEDKVIGTNYTNHAAFGDKARFYFGKTTVNIHENPKGKVNKYLQLLDKDGNVVDKDKAEGWFKGNAELKFGDKFNYRIEYHNNTGVVAVPGEAHNKSEIKIEDLFAKVSDKGLRPVLNGYITSDLKKFEVIYKIEDKAYTEAELKKAIENKEVKLADVTSIIWKGEIPDNTTKHFDIPMMIPELDAKIKDGKVVYIGTDGKEHELGDADKFFNLKSLVDPNAEMAFENKVKDSNTVTVYLEKNRFIKLFKEFFAANGEKIKKNRPEMKFDIYQYQTDKDGNPIRDENGNIIKVKVLDKDGKPLQLVVNEKNNFTDMKSNLPLFKKTISVGKDGRVIETVTNYKYELVENDASGYDVQFEVLDNGKDQLGFVIKAKNTEKPEKPEEPHNPPEEPKNPPEEPETPPETPEKPEKPEYPNKEDVPEKPETGKVDQGKDHPKTPDKSHGKNNLPKTGLVEDLSLLYLSGLAFVVLLFLRRKKFAR